jgi:hypothetical protein
MRFSGKYAILLPISRVAMDQIEKKIGGSQVNGSDLFLKSGYSISELDSSAVMAVISSGVIFPFPIIGREIMILRSSQLISTISMN